MEYASRAVGNAGLTTGIIGTALGALNGAGGLDLLNFGLVYLRYSKWTAFLHLLKSISE